jgi:hypothetical protein
MEKETVISRAASIYFIILSLICITFFSGCCSDGMDIKIKKSMTTNLNKYHLAFIVVEDYKWDMANRDMSLSNSGIYINVKLSGLLREQGVKVTSSDKDPIDLKVECNFHRSLGCIHVGRHFNAECVHVSFINLKLIDMNTKEIIGEVECIRPSLKKLPPEFVELMFNELMKSGKIEEKK